MRRGPRAPPRLPLQLVEESWSRPHRSQGFAPWPADQLHVIGGGRRAYISSEADPTEQAGREAGQTPEEAGLERRARALAAFKDHPEVVRGECCWAGP